MKLKNIKRTVLILFLIFCGTLLWARSGGSFGGFSGFRSGGGGGGFSSGRTWSSGGGYRSGTYYGGGGFLPIYWPGIVVVIVVLLLIRAINQKQLGQLQKEGSVLKYQVSFYGSTQEVQNELHALAIKAERYSGSMLNLMNEAVLLIKRNKLNIRYGNYTVFKSSSGETLERMFRQMANEERAKYNEELVRADFHQTPVRRKFKGKAEDQHNVAECIVVTLLIASKKTNYSKLPVDYTNMLAILDEATAVTDSEFAGFEVIWSPENPEDKMLEDELMYKYPTLISLV